MKNKLKLGSIVLLLLIFFASSCEKENLTIKTSEKQLESNNQTKNKNKRGSFNFFTKLYTQDEADGPTIPASGSIIIESNGEEIYNGQIETTGSIIKISERPSYIISIEKEAYISYRQTFTNAELKAHKVTRETFPLEVVLEKSNLEVSLIGTYGIVGKETEISISTNYLKAKHNINSYRLELSYETTYLSYSGYNLEGTLDDSATVSIIDDNTTGTLTIVSNSASILSGEGNLINLEFTTQLQGTTTLNVNSFSYNSGEVTNLNGTNINVYRYGDIDNDGTILAYDCAILHNYLVGNPIAGISIPWAAWRLEIADVDGDLDVDIDDVTLIGEYAVKLITEFPVESSPN
ncbi:MAG: hypothetical protein GY756_11775 [bacterium]|nr:hypothetical protein [bacterium]